MITIPYNHEYHQRNVRQTKDEILLSIPNKGDVGQIRTRDHVQAHRIENFLKAWRCDAFRWEKSERYMDIRFTLTKLEDTPLPDYSGWVEVESHTKNTNNASPP